MTETIAKGTRAIRVRRGNMEAIFPIDPGVFTDAPVADVARTALVAMLRLQMKTPTRADTPIRVDDTPIALRVIGRDAALEPSLPLSMQTEGLWEIRELPVQGQTDATARLPVCALELVDAERASIIFTG